MPKKSKVSTVPSKKPSRLVYARKCKEKHLKGLSGSISVELHESISAGPSGSSGPVSSNSSKATSGLAKSTQSSITPSPISSNLPKASSRKLPMKLLHTHRQSTMAGLSESTSAGPSGSTSAGMYEFALSSSSGSATLGLSGSTLNLVSESESNSSAESNSEAESNSVSDTKSGSKFNKKKLLSLVKINDVKLIKFEKIVKRASSIEEINKEIPLNLSKFHARIVRLNEYTEKPMPISDPVYHLNNGFRAVLQMMNKQEFFIALIVNSRKTEPYLLFTAYLEAYMMHMNFNLIKRRSSNTKQIRTIENQWPKSKWNESTKQFVCDTVRLIFNGWWIDNRLLEMFLVYEQYKHLERAGVIKLSPNGPGGRLQLSSVNIPPDESHDYAVLRNFVCVEYTDKHLKLLKNSFLNFGAMLLKELATEYVKAGGKLLKAAMVTDAVRKLNIAFFPKGAEPPAPADLYYAHAGFSVVISDAQAERDANRLGWSKDMAYPLDGTRFSEGMKSLQKQLLKCKNSNQIAEIGHKLCVYQPRGKKRRKKTKQLYLFSEPSDSEASD